jgi:hypothetical protein
LGEGLWRQEAVSEVRVVFIEVQMWAKMTDDAKQFTYYGTLEKADCPFCYKKITLNAKTVRFFVICDKCGEIIQTEVKKEPTRQ